MNSARRIITIIFRFGAVCMVLRLLYNWVAFLLTPVPALVGTEMDRIHGLQVEGMFRSSVVVILCAIALYWLAPFLARLVTMGREE